MTASASAPALREARCASLALNTAACTSHRARDEGERPPVGAGGFRRTQADHDQRGTVRARSMLECCSSFLVIASAGAPAPPRDTRRWLGAWRWKPRLARRTTGKHRMREASYWHSTVLQLTSRPQAARYGTRAASSSAGSHPSDSERRRTATDENMPRQDSGTPPTPPIRFPLSDPVLVP